MLDPETFHHCVTAPIRCELHPNGSCPVTRCTDPNCQATYWPA